MKKNVSKAWIKAAQLEKTTAIAIPSEDDANFAIIHVPRSWAGKRIFAMTSECYQELKGRRNPT
jgi:hypothetical protein